MQRVLKDLLETSDHHPPALNYLEAMACPYGCINGGGSVRATASNATATSSTILVKETPAETKARVCQTLDNLVTPSHVSTSKSHADALIRYQTRYHVVPPMHHTMGAAAGVKVQDMQW